MTVRERLIRVMQELPEDATFEDAMEAIVILDKLARGLEQAEAGKVVSQEEAERRILATVRGE